MKINNDIKKKILNGEIVVLEHKTKNEIENIILEKEEFRDLIGYQENIEIMNDCIILLTSNQVNYNDNLYKLIYGQKLVINIFEEYANYFIDSVKDNVEEI